VNSLYGQQAVRGPRTCVSLRHLEAISVYHGMYGSSITRPSIKAANNPIEACPQVKGLSCRGILHTAHQQHRCLVMLSLLWGRNEQASLCFSIESLTERMSVAKSIVAEVLLAVPVNFNFVGLLEAKCRCLHPTCGNT
jgi:hypothetical protein